MGENHQFLYSNTISMNFKWSEKTGKVDMSRLEMEERMMKNEEERKNTIKDFCENYRKRSEKKGRKWQNLNFQRFWIPYLLSIWVYI